MVERKKIAGKGGGDWGGNSGDWWRGKLSLLPSSPISSLSLAQFTFHRGFIFLPFHYLRAWNRLPCGVLTWPVYRAPRTQGRATSRPGRSNKKQKTVSMKKSTRVYHSNGQRQRIHIHDTAEIRALFPVRHLDFESAVNPFTPKFKKYNLPAFYREMYKWCNEILVVQSLFIGVKLWKANFFILCGVMWYYWWGCRRSLNFITHGSERVNAQNDDFKAVLLARIHAC